MLKMLRKDNRGFTLVELMMVIVILGVLAGVAVPLMGRMRNSAWESKLRTLADAVGAAAVMDANINNEAPALGDVEEMVKLPDDVKLVEAVGDAPAASDCAGIDKEGCLVYKAVSGSPNKILISGGRKDGANLLFDNEYHWE